MNENDKKKLVDKLLSIAKNEIRITYRTSEELVCGAVSKIGGKPFVPIGFKWPYYKGTTYGDEESKSRPLSFLAQINLKEVTSFDKDNLLPKSGVLSFFYELETMKWGFDPIDLGAAKVLFFSDETALSIIDFPDDMDKDLVIPELIVDFSEHISIPEYGEFSDESKPKWEDYDECSIEVGYTPDEWGEYTKLLGYPDVIQSPMQEECESVTRGYRLGNPEDYAKIPVGEKFDIKAKAGEWTLLFQMGTIEIDDFELMFGDCGHIYFWIKKSDLANLNFNNIWLILQCL